MGSLVCVFVKAVESVAAIYILRFQIKQHNSIIGAGLELSMDRGSILVVRAIIVKMSSLNVLYPLRGLVLYTRLATNIRTAVA